MSDVRSAPAEYNQSYELLLSLADANTDLRSAPALGLSAQDVNTLDTIAEIFRERNLRRLSAKFKANKENVLLIWKNAAEGRHLLDELHSCPEIADLAEPSLATDIPYIDNLRNISFVYRAYACLKTCEGDGQVAVDELIKLHSTFRKLTVNARFLITRLVCYAGSVAAVNTADFIANNPKTSRKQIEQLAQHFQPPPDEHMSLKNSIIFEYLVFKNTLNNLFEQHERVLFALHLPVLLKYNSTLRVYRNFCDPWIARQEGREQMDKIRGWPTVYPNLPVEFGSSGRLPWYYTAYNPCGSVAISIWTPAFEGLNRVKAKMQIYYDLLTIVLNNRLGRPVNLKAHAYGDEYIIDVENSKIFSPGPDGEAETGDDIELPIDPNVVDFTSEPAEKRGSL